VAIEPPFRPLLAKERVRRGIIDDGRKPGFFDRFRSARSTPVFRPDLSVFPEPVPPGGWEEVAEFQVAPRADASLPPQVAGALLRSLSGVSSHLSLEIIGLDSGVSVQLACASADQSNIRRSLRGYAPEIHVRERSNFLRDAWDAADGFASVQHLALCERSFRVLRTEVKGGPDPYIPIVERMDGIGTGELVLLQVLFAPTRSPWGPEFEAFVSNIEDVDKVLPSVREKFSEQTFATVIRVAAISPVEERAVKLAADIAEAVHVVSRSQENELTLWRLRHDMEQELLDIPERQTRRFGALLSLSELQSLVHVPSESVRSSRLERQTGRTKAAPASAVGGTLVLGINEHEGHEQRIALSAQQRLRHIHVIGSSGSGKSTLLLSMAIQDIEQGYGFAVLDPHGDLVEDIIARIPPERSGDVILIDPSDEAFPVGFNVLAARRDSEKTLLASDFVAVFRRLATTTFGDQMATVLGNAVLAILESPSGGTLIDLRNFLVDARVRTHALAKVEDSEVVRYWREEFPLLKGSPQASILTRLNTFLRPKALRYMVAQRGERLDIRAVMDGRKILLAKLSHGLIGEENAHLLGSLLVSRIAQAAMSRQDEAEIERSLFTLYVDEFHHFVTPSVATILTSVRKYGLGLCLAHHEMRQLKTRSEDVASAVLANAFTRIAFRVGEQDARTLADGLSFFESKDLQNQNVGKAIARLERPDADFNLETLLPEAVPADVQASRTAAVREASRKVYATPRTEVEESLRSAPAPEPSPSKRAANGPSDSESEAGKPGRGGAEHKYVQGLVRRIAEKRGFSVYLEKRILDGHGHVDVALEREGLSIGCEISVTTRAAHEAGNLAKLLVAGFDYAVLITTKNRLRKAVFGAMDGGESEHIRVLTPEAFIGFLDKVSGNRHVTKKRVKAGVAPAPGSARRTGLIPADDAAARMGIKPQTLAKMRVSGRSPPYHKIGGLVFYDSEELEVWIASQRRRSTSDSGSPVT
jgi:hypothetical protein